MMYVFFLTIPFGIMKLFYQAVVYERVIYFTWKKYNYIYSYAVHLS